MVEIMFAIKSRLCRDFVPPRNFPPLYLTVPGLNVKDLNPQVLSLVGYKKGPATYVRGCPLGQNTIYIIYS
jgi:hypothetical protein